MAGSSTAESRPDPKFFFDLASPESYLSAERILPMVSVVVEWVPIRDPGPGFGHFRCAEEQEIVMGELERTAAARGANSARTASQSTPPKLGSK